MTTGRRQGAALILKDRLSHELSQTMGMGHSHRIPRVGPVSGSLSGLWGMTLCLPKATDGVGETVHDFLPAPVSSSLLWLLALTGIGLLLFVLTGVGVFFLLRGRGRTEVKRALPAARVGDLLGNGRYRIARILEGTGTTARYEVETVPPFRVCPNCMAPSFAPEEETCERCGSRLPSGDHPTLLTAREVPNAKGLIHALAILNRAPEHPTVTRPVELVTERGEGEEPRYYLVEPRTSARPITALELPRPLEEVLEWGVALAQGLAYFHEHGLVFHELTGDDVAISEAGACWRSLENLVDARTEASTSAPDPETRNVRALAELLHHLSTGGSHAEPAGVLPQEAVRLFSQILGSNGRLKAADFAVALQMTRETLLQHQCVTFRIGAKTDIGRVRKVNEDSILALDLSRECDGGRAAVGFFVVADGVGGHMAGDVASQVTVESLTASAQALQEMVCSEYFPEAGSWLVSAAQVANNKLYERRLALGNDMGSTLVMALLQGKLATVLNVGDSRAYWLQPSGIEQISTDHSLVQRLVAIGQLTPAEARHHPQRSVIYRVMGDKSDLKYDLFHVTLGVGDALLLCSDGLSDMVEDETIWETWRASDSPQAACDRLVTLANEAGGHDNISVLIVEIAGCPRSRSSTR